MERRSAVLLILIFGGFFAALIALAIVAYSFSGGAALKRSFGKGNVGVIEIRGVIEDAERALEDIRFFEEDEGIRAIVVRIDSPGGGAAASQEIFTELKRLREKKHVVASMASTAASGGYYVALPAHRIMANPGTLTASIGVISQLPQLTELSEKIGIEMHTVTSGAAKDVGNPFRDFDPADRAFFQQLVDDIHRQFVGAVVESRSLPEAEVSRVADGRVMTGQQALEAGLIDDLGNFNDATRLALQLAGIEGEPELVYPPRAKPSFFREVLRGSAAELVQAFWQEARRQVSAEPFPQGAQLRAPNF